MGARAISADGPRADDGRGRSRSCPVPSPRRSTCRRRRRSRRSRTSTCRAGSSASRRSRSTATTARSASRCPTVAPPPRTTRPLRDAAAAEVKVEKVIEYRPVRKRLPKRRTSQTTSFAVGGAEGYLTAGTYDDGPRRDLPQVRQAGLDPGRRDGRLLDRHLDRPAVRRAAGDVRREVHQHALRAGRPDRRPGRADGAVDHGLRLPPPGAGLPRLRDPLVHGHPHRRRARPPARDRLLRGRSSPTSPTRSSRTSSSRYQQSAPVVQEGRAQGRRAAKAEAQTAAEVKSGAGAASAREVSSDVHCSAELLEKFSGITADAPICMTCGTKMRPAGSCYVCEGCGSTSGCS